VKWPGYGGPKHSMNIGGMKMSKLRLTLLLIAAAMISSLAVAACGGSDEPAPEAAAPAPEAAAPAPEAAAPAPEAAAPAPEAAAPAPEAAAPAPAEEEVGTIDVGVMTIATGFGAAWGISYHTAKEIAADEFNDEGGMLVGNKRYKVELDIQDSKYEMPVMLSITEKWITQDKKKFVTTNGDPMIGLVNPKSSPAKVIHFSSTWDMKPVSTGYPYTFGYLSTQYETAPVLYDLIKERHPEAKSAMYIPVNFRFDLNAAEWTEEWAIKKGFEWKGSVIVEGEQVDFQPSATGAIAKDADVILLGCLGGNTAAVIRAIREQGYKGLVATNWACASLDQLVAAFEGELELIENFIGIEPIHYLGDPDLDILLASYEERAAGSGFAPVGLTDYYYGLKYLLFGIEKAGTVDDPDKIAKTIETMEVPNKFYPGDPIMTMGGSVRHGQAHQLQVPLAVNIIENGEISTLKIFETSVE